MTKKSVKNAALSTSLKMEKPSLVNSDFYAKNVVQDPVSNTTQLNGRRNFFKNIFLVNKLLNNLERSTGNPPKQ
jgi:hypothetical protein